MKGRPTPSAGDRTDYRQDLGLQPFQGEGGAEPLHLPVQGRALFQVLEGAAPAGPEVRTGRCRAVGTRQQDLVQDRAFGAGPEADRFAWKGADKVQNPAVREVHDTVPFTAQGLYL